MLQNRRIVQVVDSDTNQVYGVYDITGMKGEMKEFYSGEFENYDEYENDMVQRGATVINVEEFKV